MLVGGTAEVQVRDSCTLTFVRGETRPVLGGFWGFCLTCAHVTIWRRTTKFNVVTYIERDVVKGVSHVIAHCTTTNASRGFSAIAWVSFSVSECCSASCEALSLKTFLMCCCLAVNLSRLLKLTLHCLCCVVQSRLSTNKNAVFNKRKCSCRFLCKFIQVMRMPKLSK